MTTETTITIIDPMLPIYAEAYKTTIRTIPLDQSILDVFAEAVRNCENTITLDDLDRYIEEMEEKGDA